MKKSILSIAVAALVSTSAMAGPFGGGVTGNASADIVGAGFLVGGSSATAVATGNETSAQVSGSAADITVQVNADTLCRDNQVGARLSGSVSGNTSAYVSGIGRGTSEAGALQAGGYIGSGDVRIRDRDVHNDVRFGRGGLSIENSMAGGSGRGGVDVIGAEGSAAYARNVDEGYAAQVSGAGAATTASIRIGVDARANGTHGPSGVNLLVDAKNAGEGYSYVDGVAEDAFGLGAAGYLQGSRSGGYASGGANEYAVNLSRRGVSDDYASAEGDVYASAKQGSAGGVINVGDGNASNASLTQADQKTTLKIRVDATPSDGAMASAAGTSTTVAVAATVSNVTDALGGTIAGAKASGDFAASEYTFSSADCYLGRKCRPGPEPRAKGNNGFGNGADGTPPGLIKNGGKGRNTDQDEV